MATFIVTTAATSGTPAPHSSVGWEFAAHDRDGNEVWIVTTDAPDLLMECIGGHPQVVSIHDASDDGGAALQAAIYD